MDDADVALPEGSRHQLAAVEAAGRRRAPLRAHIRAQVAVPPAVQSGGARPDDRTRDGPGAVPGLHPGPLCCEGERWVAGHGTFVSSSARLLSIDTLNSQHAVLLGVILTSN